MNFNRRNSRKNNKLNTLKYKIYCSFCLFLAILRNGKILILKRLRVYVGIEKYLSRSTTGYLTLGRETRGGRETQFTFYMFILW